MHLEMIIFTNPLEKVPICIYMSTFPAITIGQDIWTSEDNYISSSPQIFLIKRQFKQQH